jgi:ribose transport system permease protein
MTWDNISSVLMSFSTDGIVVIGMTLILIVGGIDLSVASVTAFAECLAGKMFLKGMDPWTASIITIFICGIIGFIMSIFVTKVKLTPFITTLAGMTIVRGLCFVVTKGTPLSLFTLPAKFKFIGQGFIGKVPFVIILFFVIVLVCDLMCRYSTILRKAFYTGSNEKAAIFSGINTNRMKMGIFVICSLFAGLAGIIYMSKFGAGIPGASQGLEMTAISSAVIGGASLNGGKGTILGSVLGVALLSVISNAMILLRINVYYQQLVMGCILLLAVTLDQISQNRKG